MGYGEDLSRTGIEAPQKTVIKFLRQKCTEFIFTPLSRDKCLPIDISGR